MAPHRVGSPSSYVYTARVSRFVEWNFTSSVQNPPLKLIRGIKSSHPLSGLRFLDPPRVKRRLWIWISQWLVPTSNRQYSGRHVLVCRAKTPRTQRRVPNEKWEPQKSTVVVDLVPMEWVFARNGNWNLNCWGFAIGTAASYEAPCSYVCSPYLSNNKHRRYEKGFMYGLDPHPYTWQRLE